MNLFSKENLEKESFKGNFCRTCSALIPALDRPMALATCKPWAVSATLAKDGQGWGTPRPGARGEGVPCPGGQLVVPQGPRGSTSKGGGRAPLGTAQGPLQGHRAKDLWALLLFADCAGPRVTEPLSGAMLKILKHQALSWMPALGPSWPAGSWGFQVCHGVRGGLKLRGALPKPTRRRQAQGHGHDCSVCLCTGPLSPPDALRHGSAPFTPLHTQQGARERSSQGAGVAEGLLLAYLPLLPWPQVCGTCKAQHCPGHKPLLPAAPEPIGQVTQLRPGDTAGLESLDAAWRDQVGPAHSRGRSSGPWQGRWACHTSTSVPILAAQRGSPALDSSGQKPAFPVQGPSHTSQCPGWAVHPGPSQTYSL